MITVFFVQRTLSETLPRPHYMLLYMSKQLETDGFGANHHHSSLVSLFICPLKHLTFPQLAN